jgi:type IV secretory pathway VirJ component
LSFVLDAMLRKYLLLVLVISFGIAQAQTNYILHPACSDTITSDKPLVIFFTGDSGRSFFDEKLTDSLCANNIPLMCINSYKFFRKRKTPKQTLDSILPYIDLDLKKYNRQKFIFAGYSFGSEVVPFLYNLMSDEWKERVEFIVLLSPSYNSDFKIHFFDMVGLNNRHWPYDVLHEIMKIDNKKIIVFWGKDEKKFEKKEFTKHNITVHHLKGGHRHIDVKPVIDEINERIEEGPTAQWRRCSMMQRTEHGAQIFSGLCDSSVFLRVSSSLHYPGASVRIFGSLRFAVN